MTAAQRAQYAPTGKRTPGPVRRWCGVCGTELPVRTGAGRPATYCAPETGRPCAHLAKTQAALRAEYVRVLRGVSGANRETALRSAREYLRTLSQDLTLEAAELDGDHVRAASVGSKDPAGFLGD